MIALKNRCFYFLVGVVLCAGLAASCISMTPPNPVNGALPAAPVDPALLQGTLDNGLRYFIIKNKTPKDRVSVHLNVFTGSMAETAKERGLAHYLEHMVFNGSEHFKPGELITYFQSIGMDFGGDANASTSFFKTVYDLSLPKGNKKYLKDAFLVLRDYAGGALLLQREIDRERGVIFAEKRERDSVSYRTFKKELAFELPASKLARRMPIGTDDVIRTIDRNQMKSFYDRWYRPDNMALVVVGDMDVKTAQSLIKEQFSALRPRSDAPRRVQTDISWTPHDGVRFFYHREPEAGNTHLTIERIKKRDFKPETILDFKKSNLEYIACQMFQNRLLTMVREQTADFTSASVYSGLYLRYLNVSAIQAVCEPKHWKSALRQLDVTLRQALKYGFSQSELDRVRADVVTGLNSEAAKSDTRKSASIARELLFSLNNSRLFLSPEQEKALLVPYIQKISLEQVNRAFRSLWPDDHRLVLATGNLDAGSESEKELAAVLNASASVTPEPYTLSEVKRFPYLPLSKKNTGVTNQRDNVKDLGITQVDLGNHIRINLKPTPFKKGEFIFKVVFGNGHIDMPQHLYGLSTLAEVAVAQSGFGRMDLDQLDAALAGRDVSISFKIDKTSFVLEGRAAPQEAELVLQLIYTYFMDPGFRDKSLALSKVRYRQNYESLSRDIKGVMQIRGRQFLASGDPRFGLAPPKKAEALTMKQIESWIRPAFESSPMEVSFVGEFQTEHLSSLAVKYLGTLSSRQTPKKGISGTDGKTRIVFPSGRFETFYVDSRLEKAVAHVAFLTDDFWDIMQTRKLSLLSRVLTERLRQTIRENLGASYSPYVYNNPSLIFDGYGVLNAVVNVSPDQIDVVIPQMLTLINTLAENGVKHEALEHVKAPLMNHLKVLRETNSYWLNSVLSGSFRYPQKLTWAMNLMDGYGGITAADLTELAKKYLNPDSGAILKVVPAPVE
ncbi:MAG: peptidase M16 [Desulfobacterales bacterium]|nr:MAG: peptidase M16 [Desulfobacterales bacterium]